MQQQTQKNQKQKKKTKTENYDVEISSILTVYEGWNFNSGNYLFTTDTK